MDIFTLVTSEASLRVLARTRCREWRYCISWSTESFLGLQLVKDWGVGEGHHFYLENTTLVTKGLHQAASPEAQCSPAPASSTSLNRPGSHVPWAESPLTLRVVLTQLPAPLSHAALPPLLSSH